jgi:hypothetical protein
MKLWWVFFRHKLLWLDNFFQNFVKFWPKNFIYRCTYSVFSRTQQTRTNDLVKITTFLEKNNQITYSWGTFYYMFDIFYLIGDKNVVVLTKSLVQSILQSYKWLKLPCSVFEWLPYFNLKNIFFTLQEFLESEWSLIWFLEVPNIFGCSVFRGIN